MIPKDQGELGIAFQLSKKGEVTIVNQYEPTTESGIFDSRGLQTAYIEASRTEMNAQLIQIKQSVQRKVNDMYRDVRTTRVSSDDLETENFDREELNEGDMFEYTPSSQEAKNSNSQSLPSLQKSKRPYKRVPLVDTYPEELRHIFEQHVIYVPTDVELPNEEDRSDRSHKETSTKTEQGVRIFATKYKKVADKVRPVLGTQPAEFRIERNITGDPLEGMPTLSRTPPKFKPTGRYTLERQAEFRKRHNTGFLTEQELDLIDELMCKQNKAFAWTDEEGGQFKEEYFPPVKIAVTEHVPWVLKNIPIPPGIMDEVCKQLKEKMDAGILEPSSSSYRSRWFCVLKKDGKSLRMVHSLEPLNKVTIAQSGVPPNTEEIAMRMCGRICGGSFDVYVGYNERGLHPASRDLTTIQTPFGALRLTKLPMGWTNSVPIFHDDMITIYRDEIPDHVQVYIDDVGLIGPTSAYLDKNGVAETLPENNGIRRFVWEHVNNALRVIQRMKYVGGTFSGTKTLICAEEFMVVGHWCTPRGLEVSESRLKVITNWGDLTNIGDVRSFLGTTGLFRKYIKDYSKIVAPINELRKDGVPFTWGEAQKNAMTAIKEAIKNSPAIRPLDYSPNAGVVTLAVDTSYMAVGFYITQEDPNDKKKKFFVRFGSIALNEREAKWSQAKKELYGLYRALKECTYLLSGLRGIRIEMDASYVKQMLDHPDQMPNATLNRWIEAIFYFHFTLVHVPGKIHGPDGLSRRNVYAGDQVYAEEIENTLDREPGEKAYKFELSDEAKASHKEPLELKDFLDTIDTRKGYSVQVNNIKNNADGILQLAALATSEISKWNDYDELPEALVSEKDRLLDSRLQQIKDYLLDSRKLDWLKSVEGNAIKQIALSFEMRAGQLYKRDESGGKRVVWPDERKFVLTSVHDKFGHKGVYSTEQLIRQRFWWPNMIGQIQWFIRTCYLCQKRQKTMIYKDPHFVPTPGIFEIAYIDTMMMPASNGKKGKKGMTYLAVARCGSTGWPEAKAMKEENFTTLGDWIFEDIICRWGCIRLMVSDNGPAIKKALKHIKDKYGIDNVQILPYNKQANGKVERGHWDIRQSLYKAAEGDGQRWVELLPEILWAERVTEKRSITTSPFRAVTGQYPVLPIDLQEFNWLIETPTTLLSHEDFIAYRARQLAKHNEDVAKMRKRLDNEKLKNAEKFREYNSTQIKNYNFEPGDLVLVRNTRIEQELNRKFKERWLGPFAVVKRIGGGGYVLCELNGTVLAEKVAEFRVIPFYSRNKITMDKAKLDELIDDFETIKKSLDKLVK